MKRVPLYIESIPELNTVRFSPVVALLINRQITQGRVKNFQVREFTKINYLIF